MPFSGTDIGGITHSLLRLRKMRLGRALTAGVPACKERCEYVSFYTKGERGQVWLHTPIIQRSAGRGKDQELKVILSHQQFEELEDCLNHVRPCVNKKAQ